MSELSDLIVGIIIVIIISLLWFTDFAEDSTQMTDYYGDFLSEETHM